MTSTNSSSDADDFDTLRQYILACPFLTGKAQDNSAVQAALAGLDQELQRRERNAKLQEKLDSTGATKNRIEDEWQNVEDADDDEDKKSSSFVSVKNQESPEEDEMEIINPNDDNDNGDDLGKKLSEIAIASVASSQTRVKTPLAAIAVALHAAMRSDLLGFTCMDSTDDASISSSSKGGFAAPIRELPKTLYLPKKWDQYAQGKEPLARVVLRYVKTATGSVLLKVNATDQGTNCIVQLLLLPLPVTTSQEPPIQSLTFSLERHVNLDSMTAALQSPEGKLGVPPALHYKALAEFMTEFVNTFDLASVVEDKPNKDVHGPNFLTPPIHASSCGVTNQKKYPPPDYATGGRPVAVGDGKYGYETPMIATAFPPARPQFVGDFSGDLIPGGIPGMHGMVGPPGNLMGPNHPVFLGGGGSGMTGVGDGSGFGMRPRFDPFGPPGGPQEIPGGRGGSGIDRFLQPSTLGDPNPDHLRPPNSFNTNSNNMFS